MGWKIEWLFYLLDKKSENICKKILKYKQSQFTKKKIKNCNYEN